MNTLLKFLVPLFFLMLPFSILGQCDSLNVNYYSTWNKYTEIINQTGNDYTLEYTLCNPTSENWPLALVDIYVVNTAYSPTGPNQITVGSFGNMDISGGGWDGGLTINSGACETFTYDISGTGPLLQEDIRVEVIAFNSMFSTTYCGISLLRVCESSLVLNGVEVNFHFREASNWIESTQTISGTSVVDYDAADYILMQPDFEVQLGALFHAYIDGCGGI